MGLLAERVPLHDVQDVDGFVNAALNRTGLLLSTDERVELELEGIRILYELAADWDGRGTFRGYAAGLLRRRLCSACHKLRGEVRRERLGVRWWERPAVESLDELLAA